MSSAITIIIACILIFNYLLETGLEILNARHVLPSLPKELEGIYNQEKYLQSINYQKANRNFSFFTSGLMFALSLVFFLSGGFGWLDNFLRQYTENPIFLALLYFGVIGLTLDVINTPFDWYHTFTIEQRFGFNKTTPKIFWVDKLKSLLLMAILGGGILALVIWIYNLSPEWFWLIAWAVLSLFSIFMSMFYSRLIVPLFNKQTPLPEGGLRTAIEDFAQKAGFKLRNIFVIDGSKRSSKSNAYFTGLEKQKRIVLYDTLIQNHTTEELVAVLAHEVGHYKKKHIQKGLVISLVQSLFIFFLLGLFLNNTPIAQTMGAQQASFHINIIAFGLLYTPISLVFELLGNMLSRKHEYEADLFAAKNANATAMANA